MKNVHFFWNNTHFDKAVLEASASAPGWPVQNLQNPQIARAWKCPDAGGWIKVSNDIPRTFTALVLVGHNLGLGSKVRLRVYDDNFLTEIYQQETEVIKPVYNMKELPLCNSSMLGYPSEDDLSILPRTNLIMLLDKPFCRKNTKIEIDSPNPFHVGRVILCEHWEPKINFSYGWSDNLGDDSSTQRSLGGQDWVDQKNRRYGFSFSLDNLAEGEVNGPLMKMRHHCGTSIPLVVSLLPDDAIASQYTSIHCKFSTVPKVTQPAYNRYAAKISLTEAL
ncbi:hypothetical protein [Maridesulfovibrio sp.]|uniref:hypothetical protein n=1 Tax=Maridesulfovibrio sp. TaxID=2795000 RepID=UPI0029CA38D3|nr:hypothetical protein [Maridesulfovibrio sp.]